MFLNVSGMIPKNSSDNRDRRMYAGWVVRLVAVLGFLCSGSHWVSAAESNNAAALKSESRKAEETTLESFRLMAISQGEGIAVLRSPDQKLITVRKGSSVPGAAAKLIDVLSDRLVFETQGLNGERGGAWMFRPRSSDDAVVVQRWSTKPPAGEKVPLPITNTSTLKSSAAK